MFKKGICQCARLPNTCHAAANCSKDFSKVLRAAVCEFSPFDVSPKSLHWVQIGSIPRQPMHAEPATLATEKVGHQPALVRREPIPYEDCLGSVEMSLEILQKGNQTFCIVRAGAGLEKESAASAVPSIAQRRTDREAGPVESVDQDWGFPSRRPSSPDGRALRDSAFVLEEDPRSPATSVFFTAGHLSAFQSWTASAFRSLACRAGRCSVQFITPRIFQT